MSSSDPEASGDLFDYKLIRNSLGYLFRSAGRHRFLALTAFAIALGLTVFVALFFPRKYKSEARLLAQRNMTMERVGNPSVNPYDQDGPTRAAYETVMARKNLVTMIQQANLIEDWEKTRNPVLKFKDSLIQIITGPPSEDIKADTMVEILQKRLFVYAHEGIVNITVYWPTPAMARQLVEMAQQTFLEARHVTEVAALSEGISILELHANQQQEEIKWAMQELERVLEEKRKGRTAQVRHEAPKPTVAPREAGAASPQELQQLRFLIRSKRRAYEDLEEFRQRRLAELQNQLTEQRVIYSANHPNVMDVQQRIAATQRESPQVVALKQEVQQLLSQYRSMGGKDPEGEGDMSSRRSAATVTTSDSFLQASLAGLEDDPAVGVARDQMRMAVTRYQELQMRLDAARVELDTARAAFKYRYSVVSPASTPRRPESPNVPLIVLAGIVVSIGMAFFAAVMRDLWRGRILESWEVPSRLGLPVLADVKS